MLLRHARMQLEFKGEYTGIREIRKHAAWYTSGYRNSSKLRGRINEVETYEQLEALFGRDVLISTYPFSVIDPILFALPLSVLAIIGVSMMTYKK